MIVDKNNHTYVNEIDRFVITFHLYTFIGDCGARILSFSLEELHLQVFHLHIQVFVLRLLRPYAFFQLLDAFVVKLLIACSGKRIIAVNLINVEANWSSGQTPQGLVEIGGSKVDV